MSSLAIYPGSFDPITLGHLSVLRRAAGIFDSVELVIVHNPRKQAAFSLSERLELAKISIAEAGLGAISVATLESGLLIDHARARSARVLIKGFRTATDIEYELPMAQVNRDLGNIETVYFAAEPEHGYVSSSLVREVAALGGDVARYVTPAIARALENRYQK